MSIASKSVLKNGVANFRAHLDVGLDGKDSLEDQLEELEHVDAGLRRGKDERRLHRLSVLSRLRRYLLLLGAREIIKSVVFGANEEREARLVEASHLSVPLAQ